jgi:hypothetical protein
VVGAGAGADTGVEAELVWFVRHCARNCGQVWPLVVPAAWACFHSLAHVFITLWAFAAVGPPKASPKTIAAAVSKEQNELRMSLPKPHPGMGRGAPAYREPDRSAKRIPRTALTVAPAWDYCGPSVGRRSRRRRAPAQEATVCLTRSTGPEAATRSGVPLGAARRYCVGHGATCPSSCAACSGK